jgi:type IV secretion system protein VirB6
MLFFDATKHMFTAWVSQLANYALITVLTVMVGALMLQLVQTFATQTAARGGAILTVDALNMLLVAALVFLVLRQIMPVAAGLAGGLALSSFGFVSRTVGTARKAAEMSLPAVSYIATRVVKGLTKTPKYAPEGAADVSAAAGRSKALADASVALSRHWRKP